MRDPYVKDNWEREYYESTPLPFRCVECGERAVRLTCNAHGYPVRTHPHGGMHKVGHEPIVYHYCEPCGRRQVKLNEAVIARKRA